MSGLKLIYVLLLYLLFLILLNYFTFLFFLILFFCILLLYFFVFIKFTVLFFNSTCFAIIFHLFLPVHVRMQWFIFNYFTRVALVLHTVLVNKLLRILLLSIDLMGKIFRVILYLLFILIRFIDQVTLTNWFLYCRRLFGLDVLLELLLVILFLL